MTGVERVILVLTVVLGCFAVSLAQKHDRSTEFNRSVKESLNEDEDFRNILKVLTRNTDGNREKDIDTLCEIIADYDPMVRLFIPYLLYLVFELESLILFRSVLNSRTLQWRYSLSFEFAHPKICCQQNGLKRL